MTGQPLTTGVADTFSARWLEPIEVGPRLREVHQDWLAQAGPEGMDALHAIRMKVWAAECGLSSYPRVALAEANGIPAGLLCGFARTWHRCTFIEHIAWHPVLDQQESAVLRVCEALLECAQEWSVAVGCHGWVALPDECLPDRLWRALGFSRRDPWTVHRLGYFSR